jgi:outer membrane receptor for ferrienterochelin and colicins
MFSSSRATPLAASALVLVMAVPGAGHAESYEDQPTTQVDDIVVTAAGYAQKLVDAPASISVISQEQLTQRPYITLLDAVRDLEGVDIGETRDKTGQGTISMRGMGSDYTLILINGRRQNNHGDIYPNSFGGNQFNHIPPLDAIERVEVIRGPASTLYGADAMGGVINIITKRSPDRWAGSLTVSHSIESEDAYGDDRSIDFYANGPLIEGLLNLSVRGSLYNRDASNPTYDVITDPSGEELTRSLGFGSGGKTVDNENIAGGLTLTLTPSDNHTFTFDYDNSKQSYNNAIRVNDAGVEEYPVGTVDNYGAALRIGSNGRVEPRAGYAPSQEFTRETWTLAHEGQWNFGTTKIALSHIATNNDGRTLPFSVAERQSLQGLWNAACVNLGGKVSSSTGYCAPGSAIGYNNANAWNNLSEAKKLEVMTANLSADQLAQLKAFLPRPQRVLESEQYTLDAQLNMIKNWYGEHRLLFGGQVIRGDLTDGVFGLESGEAGQAQEHNMYSLFAEDTWQATEAFALTGGIRYDDHEIFGEHFSPRLYGVYTLNPNWTIKGGVSTGFKTPKTTQLYDGVIGFGGQGTSPQFGNPNLTPETSVSTEIAVYWQGDQGHSFNATLFNNEFDDKIASQPCGAGLTLECAGTGDFADIGYNASSTRITNIDKVVIRGAELSGRYQATETISLRANYTYTDSEQKSGANKGLPLGESAKHMANASVNWAPTDRFSLMLSGEARADRYAGVHTVTNDAVYYKDYGVLHLGGSYKLTPWLTVNGRVNNLLDRDFTSYRAEFRDLDGNGSYDGTNETLFFDDYNNKDKARSFWISLNARF